MIFTEHNARQMNNPLLPALKQFASAERKKSNEWFFKTGKGEYGEHDIFIGVTVPNIRKVAKEFRELDLEIIEQSFCSKFHEERLCAILILVENFKRFHKQKDLEKMREIVDFYLANKEHVNNWDLVDLSAHHIVGQAIWDGLKDESLLDELAVSDVMWDRRIAMLSTWTFTRNKDLEPTFRIAELLLGDKEDLMHKAVGWMLRESWKRDSEKTEEFLKKHYDKIPRTSLRYAIERMGEKKRKMFLKKKF